MLDQQRKVVRVNVEVIYDDGTFDELKGVMGLDDPNHLRSDFRILSTDYGYSEHLGSGPLVCVPR